MKQGSLFQSLRKERRISQEQLVQGISTRSTLSSFEIRNTQLASGILFEYLDRLNITPDEFKRLINDKQLSAKQVLSKEYYERHYQQDLSESFLQSLLLEYQKTKDQYYLLLYLQGRLENARETSDFDLIPFKEYTKTIQNYLFKIETWGRFELSIFINLLFIFDEESIEFHFNYISKKVLAFSDDHLYSNIISTALLNGCYYSCLKQNTTLLQLFLTVFDELPDNSHYFYLKSHKNFYLAIHQYFLNKNIDFESIEQTIHLFNFSGYKTHAKRLESFIEKIIH